jgi:hypothetical protein
LRKENNSIRVTLHEKTADGVFVATPEDDGIPCFLFYGPRASIRMRCESESLAINDLTMMYGAMPQVSEVLYTQEWAMVASLKSGEIPAKHRVVRDPNVSVEPGTWNKD